MLKQNKNTLHFHLFLNFLIVFVLLLLLSFFIINIYFTNQIKNQQIDSQKQLCANLLETLDYKIVTIDTLSKNITYSKLIRKSFQNHINIYEQLNSNQIDKGNLYNNAIECSNYLSNIVGLTPSVSQVNLHDLNGNMIGFGLYSGLIMDHAKSVPWFKTTNDLSGKKHISSSHSLEWIPLDAVNQSNHYISLTRSYKDLNFNTIGYIEVVQEYDDFFENTISSQIKNAPYEIYVFNQNNECIYNPSKLKKTYSPTEVMNQDGFISTYKESDSTGLSIVFLQPDHKITEAVNKFYFYFIPITIIVFIVIIIICFIVSNKITKPLTHLTHAIKNVDLSELAITTYKEIDVSFSYYEEVKVLINAFNSMHQHLSNTVNDLLLSQNEIINLQILAMQSQMNPHFLNNNLTNISIMAEEKMYHKIQATCNDLSDMLHYISAHNVAQIELIQEIDYTMKYMNCIKIRYGDDIHLSINISDDMKCLYVPHLCIQPFVENSVKYALTKMPPWNIRIAGEITDDRWRITITDNGNGFEEEMLKKINEQIHHFDRSAEIPDLQIDGMGILNIYVRLKLIYRNYAYFKIENDLEGGARIIIGGTI